MTSILRLLTQKFGSRAPYDDLLKQNNDYLDLVDLARRLKENIPDQALQLAALNVVDVVLDGSRLVAERHRSAPVLVDGARKAVALDRANGLSIYFPPARNFTEYQAYLNHNLFYDFTNSSHWEEFLDQYYAMVGLLPEDFQGPGTITTWGATGSKIFLPLVLR